MALNIKPYMTKDHPEVTYPSKPIDEGRDAAGDRSQDMANDELAQQVEQKTFAKRMKDGIKKKIDPKGLLRRLNIIN